MARQRLDVAIVQRGLAGSRERAQALILAGDVIVAGEFARRPAVLVDENTVIELRQSLRYVGRGGLKLEAAIGAFDLPVEGAVVADVGASTGGFTDCLLQHGARRIYAIDVGYGQLHWRLRQDTRVVPIERTNVRYLESLPEACDGATIDVSFISLGLVLQPVARLVVPSGWIVALVKPQFEAGRTDVGKGGVVRNPEIHRAVIRRVARAAEALGLEPTGLISSPVLGPAGNREFLMLLRRDGSTTAPDFDLDAATDAVLAAVVPREDSAPP